MLIVSWYNLHYTVYKHTILVSVQNSYLKAKFYKCLKRMLVERREDISSKYLSHETYKFKFSNMLCNSKYHGNVACNNK